jgi:phosphatidate cytidylyltransferase
MPSRSPSLRPAAAGSAVADGALMASTPRREEPTPLAAPTPPRTRSELGARVLVAIPLLAFVIAIDLLGGDVFAAALLLLGGVCLYELYELYDDINPARIAGFIALAGLIAAAQFGTRDQLLLVAVAAIPLTFLLTIITPRGAAATGSGTRTGTFALALTLLGIWWIGLALGHAVLLRRLPHGGGIVIDVVIGTFVGDSAAYLGGRAFGRHPLAPAISPKKTVEGLIAGIGTAVGAVWVASLFQPWLHTGDALALGAGVALAAPLGDLFESFIKRDAGAKDTGRLFGAHGGALDRLDAVMFAAVAGYYIWHAILLK